MEEKETEAKPSQIVVKHVRPYTMSKDALRQRKKYGFQRNAMFSGEWTMVRMRKEIREGLKRKYGSLQKAFDFALTAN